MQQSITGMRLVSFPSEEVEGSAFSELMLIEKSVRVVNEGQYIITEKQCEHLKSRGIKYNIDKIL